jgi:uncharacterized protein DUF4389/zinc ribbon protein
MSYPAHYAVSYEARASRLTTFFRLFMLLPHAIVFVFFEIAAGVLVFIAWFAILFTGRFPAGMFGFVERTLRYYARLNAYGALMTDRFPAFGGGEPGDGYPVEYRLDSPDRLSRLTTFFRAIMVIPAYVVLYFLNLAAAVVTFAAWFVILFTGRLPRGMFDFLLFCHRYLMRVVSYYSLVTDEYPWFQPEDEPAAGTGAGFCPSCGHPRKPGEAFCASCGEPLPG